MVLNACKRCIMRWAVKAHPVLDTLVFAGEGRQGRGGTERSVFSESLSIPARNALGLTARSSKRLLQRQPLCSWLPGAMLQVVFSTTSPACIVFADSMVIKFTSFVVPFTGADASQQKPLSHELLA